MADYDLNIGENINAHLQGHILTLEVDLNEAGTISRSGKSTVIATTRGNASIKDGHGEAVSVGINIYRKVEALTR